ncbi:MAG: ABC transporter permease [Coriobacteriales bacterium]|jgi:ABC-type multidrug transport system permease subunit|nr:ABC transporter permease [Coriobacteriales bacterium]
MMFTTFIYNLKVLIRDKSVLLWAVAFPLILITLFYLIFSKLDAIYEVDPMPIIVVEDANYAQAPEFSSLIDQLGKSGGEDSNALLALTAVSSESEARNTMAEGDYLGFILVDSTGQPKYFMNSREATSLDTIASIKQGIVLGILDRYTQNADMVQSIAQTNPGLLADPVFLQSLTDQQSYTEPVSLTANPPSDAMRYYYAVLAFSTLMMMSFGLSAINFWKANTSQLGARRALGGQPWVRSLAPTLLAAWILSFVCVMVGFVYLRFGFGVSFGGKEGAVIGLLAVGSLVATLLGGLIGATPLAAGLKSGVSAFITTFLSVFAGLYGPGTQRLGDYVANNLPALSIINPVRQVADAFYSLYFYDGYGRFAEILLTLVVMAAVFFIASLLLMRRQRYKAL